MPINTSTIGTQIFSHNGRDWWFNRPSNWDPEDPDSHLLVSWSGNGEDTTSNITNQRIPNLFTGGSPWNANVVLNDNRVIKIATLGLPNYGYNHNSFHAPIEHVISAFNMPTDGDAHLRYQMFMLSGGGIRGWRYLTNYFSNSSPDTSHLFKKRLYASAQLNITTYVMTWNQIQTISKGGWDWLHTGDADTTTTLAQAQTFLANLRSNKRITIYPGVGHSSVVWNASYNTTGTSTNNGGNVESGLSMGLRWLCDPRDGFKQEPVVIYGATMI